MCIYCSYGSSFAMESSKEKKNKKKANTAVENNKNACLEIAAKKIRYTETEIDGHPIIVFREHVGPALPAEPAVCSRKRRGADCRSPKRRYEPQPFDWRNQVTFYVNRGDSDGDGKQLLLSDAAVPAATAIGRKGRPKGSKNKSSWQSSSSDPFNYQCEERSFAYTFDGPKKCGSCERTYDGDPLAHCAEYHKTSCPICGRTYKPSLASHIKSHGAQSVTLTVTCYECYECKEKFGNAAVMAEHVLDEHVGRSVAGNATSAAAAAAAAAAVLSKDVATCCACDSTDFPSTVDGLREHVVAAHSGDCGRDDFPDDCGYCGEPIVGRSTTDLVRHLVDEHLERTAAVAAPPVDNRHDDDDDGDGDYECALCGVQFQGRTAYVGHLVAAHCSRKTFSHPAAYRCRACQANFKTQINVLRHACNKIKSPYCERCDKTFPSKMRYAFHLQFHEHPACAPMHLHCDACLAEFDDEYQLYDHIRFRHEAHDKAVCEVCGRTFKSSMGLHIHRRYHGGSRNFACKSCDKSFLNKSTLREHEISHMDVKPFRCHICGQYLSRASRLRSHVKTHRAAESTEQKCYCCGACGFVAPGPAVLAEHANKERHGRDAVLRQLASVVKCEYCDSTYLNAAYLDEHRNAAHERTGSDSEAFVCLVCSSTFCTYSRLTTHKLTHGINMESSLTGGGDADRETFHIPQFFSCQYCAKMCLHYTYFCLHRRLKHPPGLQSYDCDECSADFKTSWKLSYHKKTAHGRPPAEKSEHAFQCTVCSRKFVKIGALNLHKTRTHIDVVGGGGGGGGGDADVCSSKKYLCHRCGKIFSSECSLRNHGKIHADGQQPSRGRRRGDPVTAAPPPPPPPLPQPHVRQRDSTVVVDGSTTAAVNGSKISCPYCARRIDDKKKFVEHVNRHLREDKFAASQRHGGNVCELCDERLENSAILKYHMNNHVIFDEILLCQACCTPFLSSAALHSHAATQCPARARDRLPPTPPSPPSRPRACVPETPQKWCTVDDTVVPPPLVVDCSGIFKSVPMPPRPTEALPAIVIMPPPSEALPVNVTPPPTEALPAIVVTPRPTEALPAIVVTPPPSEAIPASVTPPPSEAIPAIVVTPPPSEAIPASVTPPPTEATLASVTPSSSKAIPGSVTTPQPDDKSSVLDELLAIISTPCTLAALEAVDLPPSNKFIDIFNSISHSLEERQE